MPNKKMFDSLLEYKDKSGNALTIYLGIKPGVVNFRPLRTNIKNLLKTIPKTNRKALHKEINAINNLIQSSPPKGKGLAIFASPERFETFTLAESPPRNLISVGDCWTMFPLLYIGQFNPTLLLTIIHKNKVRLYRIQPKVKRLLVIKKKKEKRARRLGFFGRAGTSGGGTSEERRKQEESLSSFLKDAARKITSRTEVEIAKIQGNVLMATVGKGKSAQIYESHIPKLQQRKTVFIRKHISRETDEKLRAIAQLAAKQAWYKKTDLTKKAIEASKKNKSTIGMRKTLTVLQEGRVKRAILLIKETIPGAVCTKCDYIIPIKNRGCPICSSKTELKDDITELIVRKGLKMADEVLLTLNKLPEDEIAAATLRY